MISNKDTNAWSYSELDLPPSSVLYKIFEHLGQQQGIIWAKPELRVAGQPLNLFISVQPLPQHAKIAGDAVCTLRYFYGYDSMRFGCSNTALCLYAWPIAPNSPEMAERHYNRCAGADGINGEPTTFLIIQVKLGGIVTCCR